MTERWFKLWISTPGGLTMHYKPLHDFESIFNNAIEHFPVIDITADVMKLPHLPNIPVSWKAAAK